MFLRKWGNYGAKSHNTQKISSDAYLHGHWHLQNYSFTFIICLCLLPGTEISEETLNQKEVKRILQRERRTQDSYVKRQHGVENEESQISCFLGDG